MALALPKNDDTLELVNTAVGCCTGYLKPLPDADEMKDNGAVVVEYRRPGPPSDCHAATGRFCLCDGPPRGDKSGKGNKVKLSI